MEMMEEKQDKKLGEEQPTRSRHMMMNVRMSGDNNNSNF